MSLAPSTSTKRRLSLSPAPDPLPGSAGDQVASDRSSGGSSLPKRVKQEGTSVYHESDAESDHLVDRMRVLRGTASLPLTSYFGDRGDWCLMDTYGVGTKEFRLEEEERNYAISFDLSGDAMTENSWAVFRFGLENGRAQFNLDGSGGDWVKSPSLKTLGGWHHGEEGHIAHQDPKSAMTYFFYPHDSIKPSFAAHISTCGPERLVDVNALVEGTMYTVGLKRPTVNREAEAMLKAHVDGVSADPKFGEAFSLEALTSFCKSDKLHLGDD